MDAPYLVVGLGNPGLEYARTRHNAGFMAVERAAEQWGAHWRRGEKFSSRICRADADGKTVWLQEPQTFMNASGTAVAGLATFYKIPLRHLLVVVDDADLGLGQIRLRERGSSGGHHGLESIEQHLGSREYPRLRIGIGRQAPSQREITGYVLGRFSPEEWALMSKVLDRAAAQIACWVREGAPKAMNEFNGAVEAPTEKDQQ